MSSLLYSLGHWAFRARKIVLLVWIAILVILGGLALTFTKGLDNSITIPGTESQAALDSLSTTFPQVSGASAQLIVVAADGQSITDPEYVTAFNDAASAISDLPQVEAAVSPFDEIAQGAISSNYKAAYISIQFDGPTASIEKTSLAELETAATNFEQELPSGSVLSLGGQIYAQKMPSVSVVELIGVVVALIVLIITFGSFIAAGMPLLTALLGVGISIALIFLATVFAPVTSTTPMLALMLGLAVGIDYALFIMSRYQDQLRRGDDAEEAAAKATGTAGSAVIFAGLTVMIALLGMGVAGIPFLTTMGTAAAVGVGVAVVISITLIPALLGFAGKRLMPKERKRSIKKQSQRNDTDNAAISSSLPDKPNKFFSGWVNTVTRFPILTIAAVVALIAAIALPALGLRLALPDAGSNPVNDRARITYDLVAENFGEGYNGPLLVTGTIVTSEDPLGLMADLKAEMEKLPGVAAVPLSTPNMTADTGIVQVIPEGAPASQETEELVNTIRDKHDYFLDKYGVDLSVTGFTAAGIDVSEQLGNALLPFGIIVVGLSLILLTMVFRSIWVPIKAAVGYLFSVAAAFGVVALVFQQGFGASLIHIDKTGPVLSFMPIIVMGILFGLAMDYEVFLVARMREDYVHSGKARESIKTGFIGSAKVVTAAAVIMFAVFAAFVPEGDANMKAIALALAVGIFIDAFVVRMTLVPAVLHLLGDKAWWIPKWLDRMLPFFDVEGEGMIHELSLKNWPAEKNMAVAADGLSLAYTSGDKSFFENLDLRIPAGSTVLVHGSDRTTVSALLLTISGRLEPEAGKLKTAGFVLPVRSAAVRSRVALIDIATHANKNAVNAVEDALNENPDILILDNLDTISAHSERRGIKKLLRAQFDNARSAKNQLTIIAGIGSSGAIKHWSEYLLIDNDIVVLDVDPVSDIAQKVEA